MGPCMTGLWLGSYSWANWTPGSIAAPLAGRGEARWKKYCSNLECLKLSRFQGDCISPTTASVIFANDLYPSCVWLWGTLWLFPQSVLFLRLNLCVYGRGVVFECQHLLGIRHCRSHNFPKAGEGGETTQSASQPTNAFPTILSSPQQNIACDTGYCCVH